MNRMQWTTLGVAVALSTLLAACGGGSSDASSAASTASSTTSTSSTSNTTTSATSTATNVTASGIVTAFGSVIVNGTEYAVDGSTTVVNGDLDDASSSYSALKVGMTVEVMTASSGYASLVRYTSAVSGEVDAIDTANSTLTVLGQKVVVSSGTSFAGSKTSGASTVAITALNNVSVGDYVVVYGYESCTTSTNTTSCTGDATQLLASLVYEPTVAGVYRTVGYATDISTLSDSFAIGGLTVSYTTTGNSATACSPSPCSIADGNYVEVRSSTAPTSSSGALTLAASVIETNSRSPVLISGATVSIQGPVANLDVSVHAFSLQGVTINGSALAATVAALTANEIVEVTGTVTSSGSVTATAITVENQATFSLTAPLTAESAAADTLVVLGQTFTVNSSTRFIDESQEVQTFNLSNFATVLSIGDHLIVSGYAGASGNIATRVERIPTPSTAGVSVQGVVSADSTSADTLTIGGVTVDLDSSTTLTYPGSGSSTSVAAFIDAIAVGSTVVNAVGTAGSTSGTMTASSAGLFSANCGWASNGN